MIYNLEKMMINIVDNWDSSIFFHGGDTSSAGYTQEQYELLGYENKQQFTLDDFFREFNFSNRIKGDNIGQILNDDDKYILVEHAEALFCNVLEKDKIYRYMLKLALHVNRYRYLKTRNKSINNLKTTIRPNLKKNYSKKEKEEKLKKLAEEMIILMGGHHVRHKGITDELKKVMQHPHIYLLANKVKIAIPKKEIQNYLFKLKLKRPTEVKNFIEAIKS